MRKAVLFLMVILILGLLGLPGTHMASISASAQSNPPTLCNSIVCIQFENPPSDMGGKTGKLTQFKVDLNRDSNPADDPNLFIGDIRGWQVLGLRYSNCWADINGNYDVSSDRVVFTRTNSDAGIKEKLTYTLDPSKTVFYADTDLTIMNDRKDDITYGMAFISDIYVTSDPGETTYVKGFGIDDNYVDSADPQKVYSWAKNLGFNATIRRGKYTSGYVTTINAPDSHLIYMKIERPDVGTYYLGIYSYSPKYAHLITASSWAHTKQISFYLGTPGEELHSGEQLTGKFAIIYAPTKDNLFDIAKELGYSPASSQKRSPKTFQYLSLEDLSQWKYYRPIIIKEQSGQTLENFQVLIKLNSNNFDFSKAQPDGSDIRIVDESGNFLPYWIEEWNLTAKRARIWTIVPRIPANSEVKLKLYYGNPDAVSRSDGEKVFEFFDDFDSLLTHHWEVSYANIRTTSYNGASVLEVSETDDTKNNIVYTPLHLVVPFVVDMKAIQPRQYYRNDQDGISVFNGGFDSGGHPFSGYAGIVSPYVNGQWSITKFYSDGSYKNLVEGGGAPYLGTWKTLELSIGRGGNLRFCVSGWCKSFIDPQSYETFKYLAIFTDNEDPNKPLYVDWILVRKYAPKDPVPIIGREVKLAASPSSAPPLKGVDYTRYGLYGVALIGLIGIVVALRRRSSGKKEHLRAEFGSLINSGDNIVDKDPFSALEYYSKAFKVAKSLGEASLIAQAEEKLNTVRGTVTGEINSLLTKGDTALKKGNYDKALAYYREALGLAEKLHDQRKAEEIHKKMENVHRVRRIRELTSEGDVLMEQEKYSEALKRYKEALSIAKELGDAYFIEVLKGRTSKANEIVESINREVSSLVAEAERAMMDEDYESAREKLSQAIVLAEKIGGTVSVEEIKEKLEEAKARKELNEKLKAARESKDYSKAIALYREALELARQLGDEGVVSQVNSEIEEVEKAHLLETLRSGIEFILPREIPYGRESTLSINVENRLDVPIENLTIDLSELSAYFTMEAESVTFPPIKPGRRLGKDIQITPQFKGDFDFSVKISSSLGETFKPLRIKVGDYYSPAQFTPKPLTPKAAPDELSALYTDFQYIGEGGFARVFKAKRKRDGKVVAVKVPKTLDPATGKAFVREISNWLHLKHPNIVELYDVNVIPIPYLEMEYCEGSLARLGKPMDVERASQIVFNIAEGLKYAHARRIIHRDLKPSNILLKQGIPKISDWGLSKVMSESRSSTLSSFTPYYASPEQLSPKRFGGTDERTDIWQLGVLFYELVTGRLPFEGRDLGEVTYAIINEEPVPPGQLNPEAKAVEPIIMKMLAKRKEERYAGVAELQRDLAGVLNMTYVEGLRKSTDLKRTVFYIGDLALINLKAGNTAEALKYLLELRDYAGRYGRDLDNLIEQVKLAVEEGVKLGEEAVVKADVIVHQIKMGR